MKRWRWAALASLILGVLVLHHEVLLGGRVYHNEDAADGYYPSHVAIVRALGHGELPTWERGAWAGWPLAVDPYYGLYYPPSAIYAVCGAVRGLGVTVALHALMAGLGMLWLMRRRKLDWGPALFAAVSLAFGSFMVERIRHIIFAQMMAWLPLILVGVEGFLAERRARWWILAAVATGMALVCGALPLAPFVVLTVGGYVAARLAAVERAARLRTFVWLGTAALAGGLIAAAQIVPTVAHLPYSPRSLGVDYQFASSYAWPDVRYLGVLVAPDLFGGADRANWFGAFNHWEMAGWYAGALTVLLAPLGLARRRPELWALAVVAVLGVLLAFGDHAPVHRFFFHYVPLYGALRCPTRALVMDLFALPILGAEGLAWLAERVRTRRAAGIAGAIGFAVAGGVVAALLWHGRYTPAITATRHAFAHFAIVAGAGGALVSLLVGGVVRAPVATFAVALVSLVDLVSVSRGSVQPKPRDWAEGTERFTAVDWLLAEHPTDRFITDYRGPFRLHNLGMTYDLEGAGGYESFTVWRYVNLLYTINNGAPYPYDKLKQDLAAGDVRRFDTPLVDLLNLRWFIGITPPASHWVERFRPPPGARPHAVHEPVWDPQLNVYENPRVLPRAFVVHHATVLPTDAAQARALAALDPRSEVLLDAAPSPAPSGSSGLEPARITANERKRVTVDAELPSPGILVLADTWYPGWRVTVDGAPAPLLRADYAFRGVALPAGHHVVEFTYRSRPAALGLWLSLLGLLSLVAVGLIGRKRSSLL